MHSKDTGGENIWGFQKMRRANIGNVEPICAAAVHTFATLLRHLTIFRSVAFRENPSDVSY